MPARLMEARFSGFCRVCRQQFPAGTRIVWEGHNRSRHASCVPEVPTIDTARMPAPAPRVVPIHHPQMQRDLDEQFVRWVAEILDECEGDLQRALARYAEYNEWWDGEFEIRVAAESRFRQAAVRAQAQTLAIRAANRAATAPAAPQRPQNAPSNPAPTARQGELSELSGWLR